jgi:hypothetical protein
MKKELKKYVAPAAAFTSLFMLACSEDDVIVDPSNDMVDTDTVTTDTVTTDTNTSDTLTNVASLVGNWNLEKITDSDGQEDVYGVEICTDIGEACYTYEMVWSFEGDGDFTQTYTNSYTENGEDYSDADVYEGSWEFLSEDSLRVITIDDYDEDDIYIDTLDLKINSITNEELLLGTTITYENIDVIDGESSVEFVETDVVVLFTKID